MLNHGSIQFDISRCIKARETINEPSIIKDGDYFMEEILKFYLRASIYTNYDPYKEYYRSLADNMEELADLILSQTIHSKELRKSRKEYLSQGKAMTIFQRNIHGGNT